MAKRKTDKERLNDYEREYRRLAAELSQVGYVWNGTVVCQMLTCGTRNCACHRDRDRRHGPYVYWKTKVKGKDISRLLDPLEEELYSQWTDNRRHLESTKRQMLAVSKKMAPLFLRRMKKEKNQSGD